MKALIGALALLMLALPATAADHDMPGMNMSAMPGMTMGTHDMPGVVTAVDHASGVIDVTSEGVKMRLHFPPASIKGLKSGDKIVLHLGFTKL